MLQSATLSQARGPTKEHLLSPLQRKSGRQSAVLVQAPSAKQRKQHVKSWTWIKLNLKNQPKKANNKKIFYERWTNLPQNLPPFFKIDNQLSMKNFLKKYRLNPMLPPPHDRLTASEEQVFIDSFIKVSAKYQARKGKYS